MSATQKVKAAAEKRRQAVAKRELERKEAARKAALEVSWGSCELSMKLRAPHHASIPFYQCIKTPTPGRAKKGRRIQAYGRNR